MSLRKRERIPGAWKHNTSSLHSDQSISTGERGLTDKLIGKRATCALNRDQKKRFLANECHIYVGHNQESPIDKLGEQGHPYFLCKVELQRRGLLKFKYNSYLQAQVLDLDGLEEYQKDEKFFLGLMEGRSCPFCSKILTP